MNITGPVDPGKGIMVSYVAISIGDVAIGFISQWFRSRKKVPMAISKYIITIISVIWFF